MIVFPTILPADMVLTSTALLKRKIETLKTPATELQTLATPSCYGMLIGPTYSLKLLKLSKDFENQTLMFEELFVLSPYVLYPMYVDMTIDHIIKLLEMCS